MVPGEYGIRILYRPTGTSTWNLVADNGTFINFNAVDVQNHQIIQLNDSLHVGSHVIVKGAPLSVNTQLINGGGSAFNGTVQAVLTNISTGAQFSVQSLSSQTIPGTNGTKSFTFTNSSVTAPAGTYVLAIQHQPTGIGSLTTTGSDYYTNPILFTILAPAGVNNVVNNMEQVAIYPNPASETVNIALNGASVETIRVMDIQGRIVETILQDNKQQIITIPVSNYRAGVYFVQLQSGSDVITKKIVVTK